MSNERCVSVLLLLYTIEIPLINPNSVHPDQTPNSAASDLRLHYLPGSIPFIGDHA